MRLLNVTCAQRRRVYLQHKRNVVILEQDLIFLLLKQHAVEHWFLPTTTDDEKDLLLSALRQRRLEILRSRSESGGTCFSLVTANFASVDRSPGHSGRLGQGPD